MGGSSLLRSSWVVYSKVGVFPMMLITIFTQNLSTSPGTGSKLCVELHMAELS
jgi:hypothetical protein